MPVNLLNVPSFVNGCRLKYLHLAGNNITELPVSTFAAVCENLSVLDLESNSLGPAFPSEGLKPCRRLTTLNLGTLDHI